jgi:hypothetical protein
MDFLNAGFVQITQHTRSKTTIKCYVALLCVGTKAIHLELVSNLTYEGFIAALQCFINRRGLTDHLYSDNSSNFVGANSKLKACACLCSKDTISVAFYSSKFTLFRMTVTGKHYVSMEEKCQ